MSLGESPSVARSEVAWWPVFVPFASLVADVSSYEVRELLYELPSIFLHLYLGTFPGTSWDGVDSQREVGGGDGEYSLVDRRTGVEYGGGSFWECAV